MNLTAQRLDPILETMLGHLPDLAFVKDRSGVFVKLNMNLLLCLGLNDRFGNPAGESLDALMTPALLEAEQIVLSEGRTLAGLETDLSLSGDGVRSYILTCMPWEQGDQGIVGTITVLRDCTDQKRRERELAEAKNLMDAVMEHLPVRVFWKDKDLVYLGCNTVFANDMGFEKPEELIGQDDYVTTMTREESDICRAEDFSVIRSGEGRYGSEEVMGPPDDQVWLRVSKVPLHDSKGESIGVLGMYEWITEEKQAQIELENALRRERELGELKTRFIATVSHEYRNPLAAIRTSTETLIRHGERLNTEMRGKRYASILREITRMTDLMEEVLFIGREELLELPKSYDAVYMSTLFDNFQSGLEPEAAERINVQGLSDEQPIIGVSLHLTQIIQNLITNALKYSEGQVDVNFEWGEDDLVFTVRDHGIGIPEEDVPHIFDSFYRSENVGMTSGTGLGLYIVQRAVDLHKGTIDCESVVGEGTAFRVWLPSRSRS